MKKMKILMLEDNQLDAELIKEELAEHKFDFTSKLVETEKDFRTAIQDFRPGLILSDYKLPEFTGFEALEIAKKLVPDIPFIIVTGSLSEEMAVDSIKKGAWDYVLKENLTRLTPAIENALKLKVEKDKSRQAEKQIKQSAQMWQDTFNSITDIIAVISNKHEFLEINQTGCEALGMNYEDIIGKKCYQLVHKTESPLKVCPCNLVFDSKKMEVSEHTEGGRHYLLTAWPIFDDNGEVTSFSHSIKDITERKKAEEQIKKDLKIKSALLQELYHRTKNNMQLIASMLKLQSRSIENKSQAGISSIDFLHDSFDAIINRIKAMSLVHQKLYKADDLSRINLKEYIQDLVNLLMMSYHIREETISLKLELEDVFVLIDTAIPLGLVLNELISNSFKHAFPDNAKGELSIRLFKDEDDAINIHLSDNGIGIPKDIELENVNTIGLQTVFNLIKHQLNGKIRYDTDRGLKWHFRFIDNLHKERV
jgi:PAS domain S-box-containing protein